jgi:hypothetical protein
LEARGFRVDTHSLPRAAQKALGWDSLRRIEESEENMWALQDMVLAMLNERDRKIRSIGEVTFVDRTPVDFVGYVNVWASRLNWKIDRRRFNQYIIDCIAAMERYDGQYFFPIRDEIPFVPEHNRGDLESREQNQDAMLQFMTRSGVEFKMIMSLDVSERANEVLSKMYSREEK